ncbi:hypothetical protein LN042_36215 [Kitasatospora sp. RB6PN24]|uniref:hypothetical protein n=1 Tax=Kitasatospora humi TaxID=2893891 RepID=UPI001E335899|nr:hypothetical protein [Kitasatospora humi]MCC9312437.1 hypothetical protein [Kitasatospora humi]
MAGTLSTSWRSAGRWFFEPSGRPGKAEGGSVAFGAGDLVDGRRGGGSDGRVGEDGRDDLILGDAAWGRDRVGPGGQFLEFATDGILEVVAVFAEAGGAQSAIPCCAAGCPFDSARRGRR